MTGKKSSRLTLNESIGLLIERQKHDDWLRFISPEGLRFLNLRYDRHGDPDKPFKLMFKRSPELKRYYPQIRNWFQENGLDWKDITVNDEKYMATELLPNTHLIEQLVSSAQINLFGISEIHISSPDSGLSLKLSGVTLPFIGLFCGFSIIICLVSYVLYQLVNLPNLGTPSLKAFKWEEAFLVVAIPVSYYGLKLSGYFPDVSKKKTSNWRKPKVLFARSTLLALLLLGFCTG